jgi:hypothetical protein
MLNGLHALERDARRRQKAAIAFSITTVLR